MEQRLQSIEANSPGVPKDV